MRPRTLVLNILGGMLAAALLCAAAPCAANSHQYEPALREEIIMVPLPAAAGWPALTATTYRPPGNGPFPLIVLNHGSPTSAEERSRMGRYRVTSRVREFISRGFAVIVPMRRGYGDTGGDWAERYGSCAAPDYYGAGERAAVDVLAATVYASTLPWVDRQRIVLFGQSAGGFASLAAASHRPAGVVAVVNMSGGRGGNPRTRPGEPCAPENMTRAISRFAQTIRIPVLWHYAENDQYFSGQHVRAWFNAFEAAGAPGTLVMRPPFGEDGHRMFASPAGLPLWTAAFDGFMRQIGFEYPIPVK